MVWSVLVMLSAGCGLEGERPQPSPSLLSIGTIARSLPTVRGEWISRTVTESAEQARRLAQILSGKSIHADMLRDFGVHDAPVWQAQLPEGIHVQYTRKFDEFRVRDTITSDVYDGPDIGLNSARQIFRNTLARMGSDGIVELDGLDPDLADISLAKTGLMRSDQAPSLQVTEYVFTVIRRVEGVKFVNSGVRIAVHRSGRIAWMKAGGARIRRDANMQLGVLVSDSHVATATMLAESSFAKKFPAQTRLRGEVLYVMPEGSTEAFVGPRYIITHSRRTVGSNGKSISSRPESLSYSLKEPYGSPVRLGAAPVPADGQDQK